MADENDTPTSETGAPVPRRRATRKAAAVPRHREINDFLARKICRDLEIPQP